jgi:predicted Zn-dependent protease
MKNYEAEDGAGFFSALNRISKQSGQSIPDWQSTHPDPAERAKSIPELAQKWRERGYEQNIDDSDEYMQKIDGIIFGNNPREGFAENGTFYHPHLKFRFNYPSGWEVVNQPTLVGVVNKEQDAVSVMQIDSKSQSPQASVLEYVNQDGFTVKSQNRTNNNGLGGYEAVASATTEDGTQYRFYVYAVSYEDNIYRFVSYCVADKFSNYVSLFEKTSTSFASLTDQRILNIEPVRLQTMKANSSADFSTFLPSSLPLDLNAEDIAIANQIGLDETVEAGSWLKIPRQ